MYDDFKLKRFSGYHGLYKNNSALERLYKFDMTCHLCQIAITSDSLTTVGFIRL